jgi:hypothetical protein
VKPPKGYRVENPFALKEGEEIYVKSLTTGRFVRGTITSVTPEQQLEGLPTFVMGEMKLKGPVSSWRKTDYFKVAEGDLFFVKTPISAISPDRQAILGIKGVVSCIRVRISQGEDAPSMWVQGRGIRIPVTEIEDATKYKDENDAGPAAEWAQRFYPDASVTFDRVYEPHPFARSSEGPEL